MINGILITDCDYRPYDIDAFNSGILPIFKLYGNFATWPLERHHEYMAFPMNDMWWNKFDIQINDKLNIYYKDHKILNCRSLINFYNIDGIDCDKCDCKGLYHNDDCKCDCFINDPDGEDQPQHRFYMYVIDGLSFNDSYSCEYTYNGSYYYTPYLNNALKIGDLHIAHSHVHIKFPYHKIKIPFIPHKVPITKNISYLMNNVYNKQIYTLILCFKNLGDFPQEFLKQLKNYIYK